MSDGEFVKIDSGLYVPKPKDQKTFVELVTFGPGWNTSLRVDIDDVDIAWEWLQNCLESDEEWHYHTHPVYGERVALSRALLAHVQSIGLAWVDLDEVRAEQEARRLHKLQALRGNGRRR